MSRSLSIAAVVLLSAGVAFGQTTLTFQQGVAGYQGCVDTWMQPETPSNCTSTGVKIDCCESSPCAPFCPNQVLMRFDNIFSVDGGPIPMGATVVSATLTVRPIDTTGLTTEVNRMLVPWVCTNVWEDFGVDGVLRDDIEAVSVSDDVFVPPPAPPSQQQIDVAASLQAWSDGAVKNGWVFAHIDGETSDDGLRLHSCDAASEANRPLLEVVFFGPPHISEIMFQSSHPPSSSDHNYWWELTNCGATSLDLLNYSWDGNAPNPGQFVFPSVILEPGESVIIVERPDINTAVSSFRSEWALPSSCKVLSAVEFGVPAFPGFGLDGDITLYDPSDSVVDSFLFGAGPTPPQGTSIERPCGGSWSLSVLGENGVRQAPNVDPGDIASPGGDCTTRPVPAVSEWGMVAMAILALTAGTVVLSRKSSVAL